MTITRIIELLKIEHKCMLRASHDECDRKCENCELVQDSQELHEMYTSVNKILKKREPMLVLNQHKLYNNDSNPNSPWIGKCPNCKKNIQSKQTKFCKFCGQEVKWDD